MSRHDDLVRLKHMRDHAREAIAFAKERNRDELDHDRMLQLSLAHLIGIIGEAASRVSQGTIDSIPRLPWSDIVGMRHRIVHGYDLLNLTTLWKTVTEDPPELIAVLDEAIAGMD